MDSSSFRRLFRRSLGFFEISGDVTFVSSLPYTALRYVVCVFIDL